MSFDKYLTEQLEEIIESNLIRVAIPYQKGNSIRVKNIIIRKHHNGYRLFNLTTNKHICTTFAKATALAVAKMTVEKVPFDLKILQKMDDKVAKYYMDALYAKRSMKTGETEERRESAEVQFDIATQEAWTALAAIERYIFDK
ncbi:MAG: hypothetical protein CL815_08270 [Coraliomargarita sp.]|nr:hypothetical protein [Coraliomargarita sp.]|tara:strand:- start:4503 stop:4931 length:429 start_codon:yes stop_codon:yes gene_type:complete